MIINILVKHVASKKHNSLNNVFKLTTIIYSYIYILNFITDAVLDFQAQQ